MIVESFLVGCIFVGTGGTSSVFLTEVSGLIVFSEGVSFFFSFFAGASTVSKSSK